jgi:hypothetical protein
MHESAILSCPETTSGRSYTITDAGFAPQFRDVYTLATILCGFRWISVPSLLMMIPLAYIVEAYTLTRLWMPALQRILPEITGDVAQLQPALWHITGSHQFASNEQAELSPEKGGIGFKGVHDTLEGMCAEAKMWNDQAGDGELKRRHEQGAIGEAWGEVKNMASGI